jgi:hypothetical protein
MAVCYDLGDPDPLNAMGLCHSRYKVRERPLHEAILVYITYLEFGHVM